LTAQLKVGDRAPAFTLKCNDGRLISLADFAGQKQVVLFFYSKDSSPSDAAEARQFRDALDRFKAMNTELIGISVDDILSHRVFEKENNLNFLLLSDTTKIVTQQYALLKREGYGSRGTFVVDKQGLLKAIFYQIKPESHLEEVVKSLKGGGAISNLPKLN